MEVNGGCESILVYFNNQLRSNVYNHALYDHFIYSTVQCTLVNIYITSDKSTMGISIRA